MNEQELRTTLRHLAGHLHHLHTEYLGSKLGAARTSQTGVRTGTTGPTSPADDTQLDYLLDAAHPIITGWAKNLAAQTAAPGLPLDQPLATWCAWLNRNRALLLAMDWAEDCIAELQDLDTELRHHIHPTDPHLQIEHRQTSKSICYRLGNMGHRITPAQLRGWARRGHITSVDINGGHNGYLLTEVLEYLSKN